MRDADISATHDHKTRFLNEPRLPVAADLYGDLLELKSDVPAGLKPHLPGLAVTIVIALAAAYLSEHYNAPLMLMGLLVGLAFNFLNADARLHLGLAFASKTLLRWGIVFVGLQVTVEQIGSLGWAAFAAIVAGIIFVMLSGTLTARVIGRNAAFGVLSGGAVAICGASAALALATVLGERRSSQAQLALVLVAVSAASALAMSFYPVLAHSLHLTDKQAGFLMGASIHDIAQALGAGYSYSPEAGQTATIVKLTRVALLAPTLAIIALIFPANDGTQHRSFGVQWFVIGFLALCGLHSSIMLPIKILSLGKLATTALLLVAVTATGIRSPMNLLLEQGWRASVPVIAATIVSFVFTLGATFLII